MEAQVGALTAPAPGGFDKASDTDASIGPLCRRRLPPGLKAVPVGHFKRLVHNRCEIAAVVDLTQRGRVGHGLRWNQIAPPKRRTVEAAFTGRFLQQALYSQRRLRPARTPVCTSRRRGG